MIIYALGNYFHVKFTLCIVNINILFIIKFSYHLLYLGSSLYQLNAMDCTAQDSTVSEDDWYCVKAEMCEQYISGNRVCAVTRGCATATQCTDSSGSIYNNDVVLSNSNNPGISSFIIYTNILYYSLCFNYL